MAMALNLPKNNLPKFTIPVRRKNWTGASSESGSREWAFTHYTKHPFTPDTPLYYYFTCGNILFSGFFPQIMISKWISQAKSTEEQFLKSKYLQASDRAQVS